MPISPSDLSDLCHAGTAGDAQGQQPARLTVIKKSSVLPLTGKTR